MTRSNDFRDATPPLSWKATKELEALREELEERFRREKFELDGKRDDMRRKLKEMAANTVRQVEEEWQTYETQREKESEQFRKRLETVLREAVDAAFVNKAADEAARILLKRILQAEKSGKHNGEIQS